MDVLVDNAGAIREGFTTTLGLFLISGFLSLVVGTLLAAMRVCPIPALRLMGAGYVNVLRNTPLVLVFVFSAFGLPVLGVQFSFFTFAVIALTAYTSAFVCEAVRSGINAVSAGQAEAARALGMTFSQNLTLIVLPQAARAVVPPLTNILVAQIRNTAVAEAFGVTEASFEMSNLLRDHPSELYWIFFGITAGYMLMVAVVALGARLIERRVLVAR